jgi:hypothetical protein
MLLELLLSMLATAHMLAGGLAAVAPLGVAAGRVLRHDDGGQVEGALRQVAWLSIVALVVAAVLGLAAGYFRYTLGGSDYGQMLERFPMRFYVITLLEWLFALLCYTAWYGSWSWGGRHPWWHLLLATVGATNLLYHFPPLMVLQRILTERPDTITADIVTRGHTLGVILSGEVVAHTLHFYALAAGFSCATTLWLTTRDGALSTLRRMAGWGGLGATVAQILTGVALVVLIPGDDASHVTGRNVFGTLCLVGTIGVAIALVVSYARIALQPDDATRWRRPAYLTVVGSLLMSMAVRVVS